MDSTLKQLLVTVRYEASPVPCKCTRFKKDLQDKLFEQVMEKENGGGGKLIICFSLSVRPSIHSFVYPPAKSYRKKVLVLAVNPLSWKLLLLSLFI